MASRVRSPLSPCDNMLRKKTLKQRRREFQRRKPIKRMSKGHSANLGRYRNEAKEFLALEENRLCVICKARREKLDEDIVQNRATEIHHYAGRIGRLLRFVPFWKPSCFFCRDWPHRNKRKARALGLLAPASKWEVMPSESDPLPI